MNRKLLSGTGLLLAVALFLAVNIISNATFTGLRLDVTENSLYTLSEGTENILGKLEEPLTLNLYFSEKMLSSYPELMSYASRVRDMLEEYASLADGNIELTVTDPEPFSEAEDRAVAAGLQSFPVTQAGDMAYFGLHAANTTDDEQLIPFFNPQKESTLEYDLTKLIYKLANPQRRVIGLVSTLPVMGSEAGPQNQGQAIPPWTVMTRLQELMEVRDLGTDFHQIDDDVDTLLLVHPKELKETALYAIDQFVLRGGNALVMIDPFAEQDRTPPPPDNPMAIPQLYSDLPKLLENWGVQMPSDQIAADPEAAIRVSYGSQRGPHQIEYLPWLRLEQRHFNQEDFITSELQIINLGTAGMLTPTEDAQTEFTPLMETGEKGGPLERDAIMFVRDPAAFLESFEPQGRAITVAARISGEIESAFPRGRPIITDGPKGKDENFVAKSDGPINLVIVADTDIMADTFWIQQQSTMGMPVAQAVASNGDFIINTLDQLSGNSDLISLRSRGEYARPFERVEKLQQEAEAKFRAQADQLKTRLQETEQKLMALQNTQDEAGGVLLTDEQREEIDRFREVQLEIRKDLRSVQHELQKNIEGLGTNLKFINIGLMPLLIAIAALIIGLTRSRRRAG